MADTPRPIEIIRADIQVLEEELQRAEDALGISLRAHVEELRNLITRSEASLGESSFTVSLRQVYDLFNG